MLGVPQRMLRAIESELSVCRKELVCLQSKEASESEDAGKLRKILNRVMYSVDGGNFETAILNLNSTTLTPSVGRRVKRDVSDLLEQLIRNTSARFRAAGMDQKYYLKFVCAVCGFAWNMFRDGVRGLFFEDSPPFPTTDANLWMAMFLNIPSENDVIRLSILDRDWKPEDFPFMSESSSIPDFLAVNVQIISLFQMAWARFFECGGIRMPVLGAYSFAGVRKWLGVIISSSSSIQVSAANDSEKSERYLGIKEILINASNFFMRYFKLMQLRPAEEQAEHERFILDLLRAAYDCMGSFREPSAGKPIRVGREAGGEPARP